MKQLFIFLYFLLFLHISWAQVFVDLSATGTNDGSSWTNAYTDLQTAIDSTNSGQIWVATGIYYPDTTDISVSFILNNNIQLYGGFKGDEDSLDQRDILTNPTVLSGDIGQDDLNAVADTITDIIGQNSLHVVEIVAGASSTTILDGFTISAGSATDASSFVHSVGGGLLCVAGASPANFHIRNCRFQANVAIDRGGGASILGGPLGTVAYTMESCTFSNNAALGSFGGGLYSAVGANGLHKPLITYCDFIGNYADFLGGGIETICASARDSTILSFSHFEGNVANLRSAGAELLTNQGSFGKITVDSCTFVRNIVPGTGFHGGGLGIIWFDGSSVNPAAVAISRCVFEENESVIGGGLSVRNWNNNNSQPTQLMNLHITDCLFRKNQARSTEIGGFGFGGGLSVFSLSGQIDLMLSSSLFEENTADGAGGLDFLPTNGAVGTATIENSQFINNRSTQFPAIAIVPFANDPDQAIVEDTATASVHFRNLTFEGNEVSLPLFAGGALGLLGINNATLEASLSQCEFRENTSVGSYLPGAALTLSGSRGKIAVQVDSSQFVQNSGVEGGAIGISPDPDLQSELEISLDLNHSLISQNTADKGAGIFIETKDDVSVYLSMSGDSLFQNTAQGSGGAIHAANLGQRELNIEMNQSWLSQDSASQGGALYMVNLANGSCQLDVESSLFQGNQASAEGGAVYLNAGLGSIRSTITNTTLYGNHSGTNGGGVYYDQVGQGTGTHSLRNSLFGYNSALSAPDVSLNNGVTVIAAATMMQDTSTNLPVILSDPGFIDPVGPDGQVGTGDEDLHLDWYSPAVNAGFDAFVNVPFDLDGNDRIQRDTVDLGAFESAFVTSIPTSQTPLFQLYPNPAEAFLFVELTLPGQGNWDLQILDLHGRVIYQELDISFNQGKGVIDLYTLVSGMYMVRLSNQTMQFSETFVKK